MVVETQNNQLELSNLSQVKDQMLEKDFQTVIEAFAKMPPEGKRQFLEGMASKDTHFNDLYTQLKKYFWNEILKLQKGKSQESKPKENKDTKETGVTNKLLGESQISFLEKNKDFSKFKEVFEEKDINGNKIATLKPDTYSAYLRYNSNKEPLAKVLGEAEIKKAKQELDESIKASSNMPYAPENMDASKTFAQNQFKEKVKQIIEKYIPIADEFVKLLNTTDIGKKIISNTALNTFDEKLKTDVNKNIGNKENAPSEVGSKIENDTKKVIGKLAEIQTNLNKEIETFKSSQEGLKQRDYITWEKILYQDIPKKYEGLIKAEIKDYAVNIGKDLITNNSPAIQDKKIFNLPLGKGNEVVLDFSELGNIKGKSSEEILKLYEKNFSNIYKDSLISKIYREITSTKGLIDISGTVIGGASAVLLSKGTFGAGVPVATLVFTAVESSYRAGMYEAFNIEGGWQAGVGIDSENDTNRDILRKKSFDLASTAVLFSLFRGSGFTEEYLIKNLKSDTFKSIMENSITNYGVKTGIEGTFFTYYTVITSNLQDAIKNGGNSKEMLDSFTNIGNIEDLTKLFAYNLGFITAVKGGAKLADKGSVLLYEKQLSREVEKLEAKGYTIVDGRFYKGNNQVPVLLVPEFNTFADLNKKLGYLSTDSYRKPENGRGGKSFNTNQVDPNKRYQKLEEYSKETQTGKVAYALNDRSIGETLQKNGLQSGKGVGEGLLKKSGFSDEEVRMFKKGELKGEKPNEMKAIKEMDKAMDVVYREFLDMKKSVIDGENLHKRYSHLGDKIIIKVEKMILKEMEAEISNSTNK